MISGSLALSGALLEDAFHDAEGPRGVLHPLLPRVTFFFLTLHLPSIFRIFFFLLFSFFFLARLSVSRGDNYASFLFFLFLSSFYDRHLRFILKISLLLRAINLFFTSSFLHSILFTLFSVVNIFVLLFVDSRDYVFFKR